MVKGQPTSRQEIENLLGIVERDRSQAYLAFRAVQELVPVNLRSTILHFDQARRKRNTLVYDQAGAATEADLKGLRASIDAFEKWVRDLVILHLDKDTG